MYLKLQPYRQISVKNRHSQKLAKRFYGPFWVLHRIGTVEYELELPSTAQIHPVFHVSLLKTCHGHPKTQIVPLPLVAAGSSSPTLQPVRVLDCRCTQTRKGMKEEFLVQWQGHDETEATWELSSSLASTFPSLDLGYKIPLNTGSDDTMEGQPTK